jgi:integrase
MYTDFILSRNFYLICPGFLCWIVARFKNNELLGSNYLVWNLVRWKGHLDKLLLSPAKIAKVKHFTALPYKEIPQFMQQLRSQPGIGVATLEFAILTATRSGEVRGAL